MKTVFLIFLTALPSAEPVNSARGSEVEGRAYRSPYACGTLPAVTSGTRFIYIS
jgi:hypothetical protein